MYNCNSVGCTERGGNGTGLIYGVHETETEMMRSIVRADVSGMIVNPTLSPLLHWLQEEGCWRRISVLPNMALYVGVDSVCVCVFIVYVYSLCMWLNPVHNSLLYLHMIIYTGLDCICVYLRVEICPVCMCVCVWSLSSAGPALLRRPLV